MSHIVQIQENTQSPGRPASPKKGSKNAESHSESSSSRSRRSRSRRSLERELKSLEVSGPPGSKQELLKNWTKSGYYSPHQPGMPIRFYLLFNQGVLVVLCPWSTAMVMLGQSLNLTTQFLGRVALSC